ncbi:diacylglycerol kinase family protein, partial [Salmonella enterica subsp. enterica serovar Cerro]|nr:diacylglycerol kinase family protein [Salmonella enterica subsp. enterica serovar Cerro]
RLRQGGFLHVDIRLQLLTVNHQLVRLAHAGGQRRFGSFKRLFMAPALGLLPLGTANDFATSAGIPEALDKALKLAIAGNAMEIDM